jgi:hypothetical protein
MPNNHQYSEGTGIFSLYFRSFRHYMPTIYTTRQSFSPHLVFAPEKKGRRTPGVEDPAHSVGASPPLIPASLDY